MIRFTCPHCHAVLVAQPKHIGREALCKNCQKNILVPEPPVAQIAPAGAFRHHRTTLTRKAFVSGMGLLLLLGGFVLGWLTAPRRPDVSEEKASSSSIASADSPASADSAGPKRSVQGQQRRLWDRDQLSRKLAGMTMQQVRQLPGDPNDIAGGGGSGRVKIFGGPGKGSGGLDYLDHLQSGGGDDEDLWTYKGILRDPRTGDASKDIWMIRFRHGRVYLSCVPIGSLP